MPVKIDEDEAPLLHGPGSPIEPGDRLDELLAKIDEYAYECPPRSWVWDLRNALHGIARDIPEKFR